MTQQNSPVTGVEVDRVTVEGSKSTSQQQTHIQFSPSDAHVWQPGGIYTISEVLNQVNQKLDEHGKQLVQIWQKLLLMERELDTLKETDSQKQTRAEKDSERAWLVLFRFLTVVALVVIIVLILRQG